MYPVSETEELFCLPKYFERLCLCLVLPHTCFMNVWIGVSPLLRCVSASLENGLCRSWNSYCLGSFHSTAFSVYLLYFMSCLACSFSRLRTLSSKYKSNILLLDINTKYWTFCSWTRNRPSGWAAFVVLWTGRMLCFELNFFLIWSQKGALVNLTEPAVVEAVSCYILEMFF